MTNFQVRWHDGSRELHETYAHAVAAVREAYPDATVVEDARTQTAVARTSNGSRTIAVVARETAESARVPTAICASTGVRYDACACSRCARGTTADAKYATNKRDVKAVVDFIADCLENHPSMNRTRVDWSDVGTIANLRESLVDLVVRISGARNEHAARASIETALNTEDVHVGEALIEAI